jgi:hypothetical protein
VDFQRASALDDWALKRERRISTELEGGAIAHVEGLHSETSELVHLWRVRGECDSRDTAVFTIGTSFSRHSWYLRLPNADGSPWAGIVRCECSSDLAPAAAIALAHTSSATLPRFASEPHKDTRAPQNLYPIGGLERELRRRLGDQALLYRALRTVAHRSAPDPRRGIAANP